MFDRIGRIADETPFVVEWFVRNGIRVWSTQEGEQRFDNHTDKLLNYIRFWQADGESEKTSVRTRTSMRQLVEEGHFKGGNAPYGYDFLQRAMEYGRGIRVLRQDEWKMLVSFIISQRKSIPAIRRAVDLLSERFGERLGSDGEGPCAGGCLDRTAHPGRVCRAGPVPAVRAGSGHRAAVPVLL